MASTTRQMFLDPAGPALIARYDQNRYPIFEKLTKKLRAFDWSPDEIDLSADAKDYRKLTPSEQDILTLNIKRQIVLDTKQGSAPSAILAPIATQSDLEVYIRKWSSNEDVHSETYTHIIRNVYPNPSQIFDEVLTIEPILKMSESINAPYERVEYFNAMKLYDPDAYADNEYEHKKALWMCLNSINALEGIRFYVSFACSWAFAELKKMKGNADLIKLIARDENVHLAGTQQMLKLLPQEDPDFKKIKEECKPDVIQMFIDVIDQEIDWAQFLFKAGSMIGLNVELLTLYIRWIGWKRMSAIGVPCPWAGGSNPLPWTQKWIAGDDVQPAPQEKAITSYRNDIKSSTNSAAFSGFEL
jgi:ribonucleoside-diphosphate reductase beta chain